MLSPLLEVKNLVKHYPKVKAVNDLSFSIREGICFGLLGPNGAGKTTTIEIIEGITEATSGEIFYRGKPMDSHFRQVCGIQFQSTALPDFLRVKEVLELFQSFYKHRADLKEVISLCNLGELLDRDVHKLSGGQRQRVLLAVALVNDPEILFLDEPTTGLDPHARRDFWDLIRAIKERGRTVVLTTHYMDEAYELCDEIVIVNQGKIQVQGSPQKLLRDFFEGVLLQIPREDYVPRDIKALESVVTLRETDVEIKSSDINQTLVTLMEQGVSLKRLRTRSPTLEDLFLHLTGRSLA